MNEDIIKEDINVENLIYEIRGKQVMIDSDLAKLYGCVNGTKTINLAVKRHINRFPERFMFQLTEVECQKVLRFQFETLNSKGNLRGQHIKYLPYVFTEEGVAMLATILRTEVAEKVSIRIMDAFVAMRHYIGNNLLEQKLINNQVIRNTEDIKLLKQIFDKFEEKDNEIYYKGQIYDAYSRIVDIFKESRNELIIIDRYADKSILDMIKKLNIHIILITKEDNKLDKLDIDKYNKQYNNLKIIFDDSFHDRYFIIDRKNVYHCGTSINNAGNRTFGINILTDDFVKNNLINYIVTTINLCEKMI